MSAMRHGKVIEAFPLIQFGAEIDVVLVAEKLVELLLIGSLRAFDLPIQPW